MSPDTKTTKRISQIQCYNYRHFWENPQVRNPILKKSERFLLKAQLNPALDSHSLTFSKIRFVSRIFKHFFTVWKFSKLFGQNSRRQIMLEKPVSFEDAPATSGMAFLGESENSSCFQWSSFYLAS